MLSTENFVKMCSIIAMDGTFSGIWTSIANGVGWLVQH